MSTRNDVAWRLRVEDVLTLIVLAGMLMFAQTRSRLAEISVDDSKTWELSFIFLPAAVLIFVMALQYATGAGGISATTTVGRIGRVARDWLPFAIFLLVYESFRAHVWERILTVDRDVQLLAIDRMIFRETPAVLLQHFITPFVTDVLAVAYFLHLVLPPIIAFTLYRRNFMLFRELLLSIFLAGALGSLTYILVPARGPGYAFPQLFVVPLQGSIERQVLGLVDAARAPRDVFPSLHVTISSIVLYYAYKYDRRWFLVFLPAVVGNWLSTIYLRYHYFIDLVAGWIYVPVVILLSRQLLGIERKWALRRTRTGSTAPIS